MVFQQTDHINVNGWLSVFDSHSGEKYQTIEQISLSHLQIFAVRQRYLSEEAELVHGMETMQM